MKMESAIGKFAQNWAVNNTENQSRPEIDTGHLIGELFSVATSQFEKQFLYGTDMMVIHKGNPKQMSVYLDSKRQTLLWVSSKTKAFLVDLYLSAVFIKRETNQNSANRIPKFYLALRQLEEQVRFVFDKEEDQKYYFHLFGSYINDLKKRNPNYSIYFSNINKIHAHLSTKNGTTNISEDQILQISKIVGLSNKKQNIEILQSCMKFHEVPNKKDIPLKCFDDYFAIQFCNSEVQPIFQQFSDEKVGDVKKDPRAILRKIMSPAQFENFLRNCQKQNSSDIKKALKKYSGDLSFYDFIRYLYDSQLNNASRIQQPPLDYPLKDYYCYSSHNTYLSGNQLTSDSQVERYSEDLENGIKCVELDIHDDGSKPLVNHAFKNLSFCKPIDFQDVIKVIKAYSHQCEMEKKTHFPIILSIENHASFQNREFMLEIITRHFGKKLFKLEQETNFPTLSYLMGNILIKTNSSQEQLRLFRKKALGKKLSSTGSLQLDFQSKRVSRFKSKRLAQKYQQFNETQFRMQKQKYYFNSWFERQEQVLFAIVKEMTKVTTIFKAKQGIKGEQLSEFGCTSLTYTSTIQAFNKNPEKLLNYTKNSWLRTYPHGSEISSYNYDPAQMMAVGAQIIALNTQTKDEFAWMMYGYFCGGYCPNPALRGFVLKPSRLRISNGLAEINKNKKVKIRIIDSGGQTVRMRFFGMPIDNKANQNSINEFSFECPDQSFIIFEIGSKYRNCIAIRWILEGYRIIEGKSKESYTDCGKRVLVEIKKYY